MHCLNLGFERITRRHRALPSSLTSTCSIVSGICDELNYNKKYQASENPERSRAWKLSIFPIWKIDTFGFWNNGHHSDVVNCGLVGKSEVFEVVTVCLNGPARCRRVYDFVW